MRILLGVLALLSGALSGCGFSDAPRFRLLEDSGVDFVNRIEDTPELNIITYLYFYDGGGVAAGDVNGDSLPDLYFTANQGPNRLYLNRGNLKFEDVTDQAGVAGKSDWDTGVTMADVNADGRLDLYVSAVDSASGLNSRNELFINNGDGTFTERAEEFGLALRSYGTQAAFFDYDLDGDLDAFLLNHSTHGERTFGSADLRMERHARAGDRLLRNDGDRFVDVSAEAGIYGGPVGYGLGVSISDLNLDGRPDIYVANDFHENDYLYINNGDGTFTERIREAVAHNSRSSMGSDAADVNNDGLPDVVVVDMLPFREDIRKTSASAESRMIANARLSAGYHQQFEQNTLLLNRGGGRFSDIGLLAGIEATDWSWAALLADLDNDGWKDLFVTNGIWRRPNDEDYLAAVMTPGAQDSLAQDPAAALDYIKMMPHVPIPNFAFRSNGDLTFDDRASSWGLGKEQVSNGAAYADLDNDGDLDLVVNNLNERAAIYENTGGGNYLSIRLDGSAKNAWGVGARVYVIRAGSLQVQENYPTRGFQSSVDPRLHFGLGSAESVDSLVVVWPDLSYEVRTEVTANQHLVLRHAEASGRFDFSRFQRASPLFADVSGDVGLDYVHRENAYLDFTREPLIPHKVSTEGPALAVGDVNGDGLEDVFAGGAKWQPASLLVQSPDGRFSNTNRNLWQADSLFEDVDAAFFDADNDDDLDLYVVSAGNEWWGEADAMRDRLYLNDGKGAFSRGQLPEFYEHGSVVRPADYDGDGDTDLFVGGRVVAKAYGAHPRSYLLRNDGGRFVDVTPESLRKPGMITDAIWSDADGDGALDLAVVGEWMAPTVFFGGSFDAAAIGPKGWWTAIDAADLNNDGIMDLVLGNLGLNSRLRASKDDPVRLYMADFDADAQDDVILTSVRESGEYLLAERDVLLDAFPSLIRKYPTYRSLGASRIDDIFPRDRLDAARTLQAEQFASMVAFGMGDREFELQTLPAQAQFAPVQAILTDDFNTDGHLDILLGQNFFGVMPVRGRYDAGYGQLLLGSRDGSFRPVEPSESGLWLEGEIRSLKQFTTSNGERLILAARNDAPLQIVRRVQTSGNVARR